MVRGNVHSASFAGDRNPNTIDYKVIRLHTH